MQATTTYLDRVRPAIRQVGERLAVLVTGAPDPDLPVPTSPDWTVREATAHLVTVAPGTPPVPSAAAPGSRTPGSCPS
jgi:Mycothiol maleylpyruvate isomerase N-terminal domain